MGEGCKSIRMQTSRKYDITPLIAIISDQFKAKTRPVKPFQRLEMRVGFSSTHVGLYDISILDFGILEGIVGFETLAVKHEEHLSAFRYSL